MDSQLTALWEDAHGFPFICDFLLQKFYKFSRKEKPDGSLPAFAWGDISTPIRSHYRNGIRFFHHPYPHFYRLPLRLAFQFPGENTGLPRFTRLTVWVRFRLSADSLLSMYSYYAKE